MSVLGSAENWADLIDPMVPVILKLILDCWAQLPQPEGEDREDDITIALCRLMKQHRTARNLMFQIDTQMVELEPDEGEEMGRMDITFRPLIPREDIYFCLEGKRLNVIKDGRRRAYASEYVSQGMQRFMTGKYAKAVLHGGMAGFVLDGDIKNAIANVAVNIKKHHLTLGMKPPGEFLHSSIVTTDNRVRETDHRRKGECFRIHHLFLAAAQ